MLQGAARVRPGLRGDGPSSRLPTPSARTTQSGIPRQVVFLPTCVNRMMGAARGDDSYKGSTLEVFTRLANKSGYQVIVPQVSEMLVVVYLQRAIWQRNLCDCIAG